MITKKERALIKTWVDVFEEDLKKGGLYEFPDGNEYPAQDYWFLEHILSIIWFNDRKTKDHKDNRHIVDLCSYIEGFPDSQIRYKNKIHITLKHSADDYSKI